MRLRLHALGAMELFEGLRPVPLPRSALPVIAYLLAYRARRVGRVELAETLWADGDRRRALRCLSTALWRINCDLTSGSVVEYLDSGADLKLNLRAPMWVDTIAVDIKVQSALRQPPAQMSKLSMQRLERGLRLYKGDFCPMVDDDWAWIERQRLRTAYLDGMHHLVAAAAARADWPRVLHWGKTLTRLEPLREDVHRLIMQAHLGCGNRGMAMAQFEECRGYLRKELGVDPMPETMAMRRHAVEAHVVTARGYPVAALSTGHRLRRVRRALALSLYELDRTIDPPPPGPR